MKLLLAATLLAATGGTVAQADYDRVQAGWSRYHVQHAFALDGTRVALYYGPKGWRHLVKDYPGPDGTTIEISYIAPPKSGQYLVKWKSQS